MKRGLELDTIRREIVRTRCSSCAHECFCSIAPETSGPFLVLITCKQATGINRVCGSTLQIVSARGVAFNRYPFGAEQYDVKFPE